MFKFTSNNILATLVVFAYASLASALPSELKGRDTDASTTITLCIDANFVNCITLPIVADTCTNFTGGLSRYDQQISSADIPAGFICTFFSNFDCLSSDNVTLQGGSYPDFTNLPGDGGAFNFNDQASSVSCSPL